MTEDPIERRVHEISYPIVGSADDWAHVAVNAGGLWWRGDTRNNPVAGPYGIGPQSHEALLADGPPVRTPPEIAVQLRAWCEVFIAGATSPPVLLWTEPHIKAHLGDASALERWDARGDTALHVVAGHGLSELVAQVLASGVHVDRPRRNGMYTPLHAAAQGVHGDVVTRLVDAGADPHRLYGGQNCLDLATESRLGPARLGALVASLLALGVDPKGGGAGRRTPLRNAQGQLREDIVKMLLEAGAERP